MLLIFDLHRKDLIKKLVEIECYLLMCIPTNDTYWLTSYFKDCSQQTVQLAEAEMLAKYKRMCFSLPRVTVMDEKHEQGDFMYCMLPYTLQEDSSPVTF